MSVARAAAGPHTAAIRPLSPRERQSHQPLPRRGEQESTASVARAAAGPHTAAMAAPLRRAGGSARGGASDVTSSRCRGGANGETP